MAVAVNVLKTYELSMAIALKLLNKSLVPIVNQALTFSRTRTFGIVRVNLGKLEIIDYQNGQQKNAMSKLSEGELARIARNRDKARSIKASRLCSRPYSRPAQSNAENGEHKADTTKSVTRTTKLIDSGGGFLIEQEVITDAAKPEHGEQPDVVEEILPIPVNYEKCEECSEQFIESYLFKNFDFSVCDKCRDPDEKHSLITRTEAKNEYLLKDCDFDRREPPLKCIVRKNPHNVRWGEMKLYLHFQVEKRALEVWGTEERLIEERELRDDKRDRAKLKKYNKNMKQLRMEMRSSLYDRTSKGPHTHEYGEETYHEDDDNYTHACTICGFVETYEKM